MVKTLRRIQYNLDTGKYYGIIILIMMLFLLSSCGRPELPNGIALKDTFSEKFLKQISETYVNDSLEVFSIQDIEVLRQKTNDNTNTTVCSIELSNENYVEKLETELMYEYYDQGGWYLDDWTINKTTVSPRQGISDIQIADMEETIFTLYPNAKFIARETDLSETLTDVFSYEVPTSAMIIGNTGIEIIEGGKIQVIYSFSETVDGAFAWQAFYNTDTFSRQWSHWKGDWNNRLPGRAAGAIYSLTINDIYYNQFNVDNMNIVLTNATYGSPVTKAMDVNLYKCPPDTTVENVVPSYSDANQTSYSSTICYFYGFIEYAKYNADPSEPQYYGCILFTENGFIVYGGGEESTNAKGELYIWYRDIADLI